MHTPLSPLPLSPCHTPPHPPAQALSKLAPHIQQVSMESNGKGVDIDGNVLPFEAGETPLMLLLLQHVHSNLDDSYSTA